jgi:protocatechuate 3,4-dioxygenase beta subunit
MSSFLWTTRRGFLIAGAGALAGAPGIAATPACTLTSEQEEGPYYVDDEKLRADITEGRPGVPLRLRIALVDSRSCAPLAHAAVDIWHCDALGVYSGFTSNSPDGPPGGGRGRGPGGPPPDGFGPGGPPPDGFPPDGPPPDFGRGFGRGPGRGPGRGRGPVDATRFLRGVQITNAKGVVEFSSLYPGWYSGRAIHVHMKTHMGGMGGHVAHTGQMFFPEDLTERIAKREPYATRLGIHRTTQSEDNVFRNQHGAEQLASIERLGKSDADGFLASVTVAVDPEASPRPVGGGGGRGPR